MQDKVLKTLEFTKIIAQLQKHASSSLGKSLSEQLMPNTDLEEVKRTQYETDEAATVYRLKGNVPLGGIFDIRSHIKRARIGGVLSPVELMETSSTLRAGRTLRRFLENMQENEIELPILYEYKDQLVNLSDLEKDINMAIGDHGEVLDSASDTLRTLRQQLRTNEARVREKLESMIRSSNAAKMLSDTIVTIRNDRFVIPVKQEYRNHYGGIIHDQSASGQTLFIEPQSIVQLNNTLQDIRVKESREVERILTALSNAVGEYADDILLNVSILAKLDFAFAKAKYAKAIHASMPIMNNQGIIKLKKARHPLIPKEEVVANDIILGETYGTMVITGPNTGGKTVTLKTVGLCTLMAMAGLQVPAMDGSELAVFKSVYADIGDEQSIEQSLSTFSSHMVNIVEILETLDFESLVLFDELGAGTDPQEGAALAISILDEAHSRGAKVIATTHYPELKAYGYNKEGVMNASVEFDVETLSPTYRLLIGVPGRSNAFEISTKLGLTERIIRNARGMIGADSNKVENMIASLETSRKEAEKDWQEAEEYLRDAEILHQDLQKQLMEYEDKKDTLIEKAKQEARQLVEKAQKEAEEIIRELRQMRIEKSAEVKEHELIEAKRRLNEAKPEESKKIRKAAVSSAKRTLKPGDEVKVLTWGQIGQLIEKISDHEWNVQMGIMKMKVDEKDLEFKKSPKPVETKTITKIKGKNFHVNLELDLRGERYENALSRVEKYIDDALLAGYPRVSIIHGKGTGALRQGVREYLKNHRSVKSMRFGEASEGGIGVTIVELK
ncbi:endonuclease MutS2 [Bacillus sp. FJAT-27986]|uniref:endonuclease MutS2 n=1 Tax=Bacillus sp. FJAT-27986 TaxID=1743146 RepID=UPI00080AD865|nr:endonuclease MutS2 [Bacillus sp. FJAT-27986]OCA81772.1 endonuclease MutS2 [Bacillus sp. FJAT-27986]